MSDDRVRPADDAPLPPASREEPRATGNDAPSPEPPPMASERSAGEPSASEPPAADAPGLVSDASTGDTPAPAPTAPTRAPAPAVAARTPPRRRVASSAGIEPPEPVIEVPRARIAAMSRRSFLLFGAGALATAAGAWWLLPDGTRARLLPGAAHHPLDTLAARVGLTRNRRERVLDRALTFDDDVAEALYSADRRVRVYDRSQVTPLRNNYDGRTPGPEYLPGWQLTLSGLASGRTARLGVADLARLPFHEQVTRLVCVEGWSAIAWWGGPRFADLLAAFPPAPGARWAAIRSAVNLDFRGRSDPYYVSIDLGTARHPQTLLATHHDGRPLTLAHGAPLRLLAPMKLGLKNIKAITDIAYVAGEPPDYWNERGYSKYDGL